jgi:hypothetical protein
MVKMAEHDIVWHDETRRTGPAATVEDQQSDGADAVADLYKSGLDPTLNVRLRHFIQRRA